LREGQRWGDLALQGLPSRFLLPDDDGEFDGELFSSRCLLEDNASLRANRSRENSDFFDEDDNVFEWFISTHIYEILSIRPLTF
jgi:hypothetical protein